MRKVRPEIRMLTLGGSRREGFKEEAKEGYSGIHREV